MPGLATAQLAFKCTTPTGTVYQNMPCDGGTPEAEAYAKQSPRSVSSAEPSERLHVLETSCVSDIVGPEIVGRVRNVGNTTLSFVRVHGAFYSATGQLLEVATSYTRPAELRPGDVGLLRMRGPGRTARCGIQSFESDNRIIPHS